MERLEQELAGLAGVPVALERPSDPAHGDYATNVALRLAPERHRPPRALAEELCALAAGLPAVERAEVAGPGFLNLFLTPAWFGEALDEIVAGGLGYGGGSAAEPERIQVELVSANPTGPLVVSAARNGAYGDSVARLLEFAGHEVEREYYYNDAGRQMERFRASVEARRNGEEPPEDGYHGAYVEDLAGLRGDPMVPMLAQIEGTLERFRIVIDSWARQSEFERELPSMLEELDTYVLDGATYVRSTAHGDERDRVIVRSPAQGGQPTYGAADAVYLRHKFGRGFDRAVYVLGADHHGYVGWLKSLAAAFGYDPERVEILVYQLVHLTEGGLTRKMSKRRGDIVLLDEFLDQVGVDAGRWYLVSRGHDQTIEIDVDLAAEKSQKNPVYYVQYAHARIAGILRNAQSPAGSGGVPATLAPEEKGLVKRLAEFPALVREATNRRGPHAIPTYAIRVADDFHRFYHEHRVLESETQVFRLALCRATQTVIARCLALVGVDAPERM